MTTFIEKRKHRTIHRLQLQYHTRHRSHPFYAFTEIDRFMHDHYLGLGRYLDHRPPPLEHNVNSNLTISSVCTNIRNFNPNAVSTSATGLPGTDGGEIETQEKAGTLFGLPWPFSARSSMRER
jgi:hypothetical protein